MPINPPAPITDRPRAPGAPPTSAAQKKRESIRQILSSLNQSFKDRTLRRLSPPQEPEENAKIQDLE